MFLCLSLCSQKTAPPLVSVFVCVSVYKVVKYFLWLICCSCPTELECEFCKNFAPASQFRGTKRFCSKTCAKRYKTHTNRLLSVCKSQVHLQKQYRHCVPPHLSVHSPVHSRFHGRYNVSCSHHFRISRGRSSAPVYDEMARRRGPHRSSSEIACAKIAGRHLPVKVCLSLHTTCLSALVIVILSVSHSVCLSHFLFVSQCRSESSRSEDVSSCEGEEEEEEDYLSPGSSFSCSRPARCGPQMDESAQGSLPLDGDHFLSASPSHWSVEEVCRFISSLQGEPSAPHSPSVYFSVCLLTLVLCL